jgi:broad specificity phosphatase PhoE
VADRARTLTLVRHSLPEMGTGLPASQWRLSAEGRRRCETLADRLAQKRISSIVTSEEPRAIETGRIVADLLGLPFETSPGLHEHERGAVQHLGDQEGFRAQVSRFFERPDQLVFGRETANQAYSRFGSAVSRVLKGHPWGNLAIVTHGTVMTLFIARASGLDPVPFWSSLGMPAFAVLSLPGLELLQVVRKVVGGPVS